MKTLDLYQLSKQQTKEKVNFENIEESKLQCLQYSHSHSIQLKSLNAKLLII